MKYLSSNKTEFKFTFLAFLSLFIISCSQPDRSHRDGEVKPTDSLSDNTSKAQLSTADVNMDGSEKSFIVNAYLQSLYSRELSTLVQKSKNDELRALGKTIISDQTKLIEDLEKIAKGKGILLERSLSKAQQKELDAIKTLASPTLDQQFIQKLQGLQSGATVIYQDGQQLANQDLKDYATNAMKIIHAQQASTTKLVNTIQGTNSQGTRPGEVSTQ